MRIDIESFQFIWEQIEKKLEEISTIPKYRLPSGRLKDFIGYEIDSTGITFKTEQYQYGDTSESFQVAWHEFNQPLEYFKSKFQAERQEIIKKDKEREERVARMKYEELKLRFEIDAYHDNCEFLETKETEPDEETRRIKNEILQESDEWKRRNEN